MTTKPQKPVRAMSRSESNARIKWHRETANRLAELGERIGHDLPLGSRDYSIDDAISVEMGRTYPNFKDV